MSKRVYLAAPWVHKDQAAELSKILEANGHTITRKWWEHDSTLEENATPEFLTNCAVEDRDGVYNADVLVVWNTAKSEGKAVEQGLAIAKGIPVIVVTPGEKPSSNIFHYLPTYKHVTNFAQALEAIGE